jgi:hypothetical protein
MCIFEHMTTNNAKMNIAELIRQNTAAKSEKRGYPRLSLRLPTEYSLRGSSRVRVGHTVDICEGGLLVNMPERVEVGQNFKIKVYYPFDSTLNHFNFLAEVVRVDSVGKSKKECRCAVKFINLSVDDRKMLRIFMKSLY